MITIQKIGLAVIHNNKLLVVRKKNTDKFILPGGKRIAGENDTDTLKREIKEELQCDIDTGILKFIGEFEDIAANEYNTIINIRLYVGALPSDSIKVDNEIIEYIWFNCSKDNVQNLSRSIKNKIIPNLISSGMLKI